MGPRIFASLGLTLVLASCTSTGAGGGFGAEDAGTGAGAAAQDAAAGDLSSATDAFQVTDVAVPLPDGSVDAGVYAPVHIGFDDQPTGTVITDQYKAHASFSTDPGDEVAVYFNHDFGTGNYITTAIVQGYQGPSLFVDFAKPVNDLKFVVLAANAAGAFADLNVFQNGAKTATVPLNGQGDPLVNVPVDLSMYEHVTRIEVVNVTDFDNVAYDDFDFSFPE